jgi:hypothetical protein
LKFLCSQLAFVFVLFLKSDMMACC